MKFLNLRSGKYFPMGDGKNWRVISPDMGARHITLNFGIHAAGQEFGQHAHDASEDVIVCLAGGTSLRQGDTYRPITGGDAVWICAGEVHGTKNTTDRETLLFSFQSPPDVALYRGERDSMRGAKAPEIPPGFVSSAQIRTMRDAPLVPGTPGQWRRVFSSETGAKAVALDHISLRFGEAASFSSGAKERVLVLTDGELTVVGQARTLEKTDVVFIEPGDSEVQLRAGTAGAVMAFAQSIIP